MKEKQRLFKKEVEDSMQSLDGITSAEPRPYFYTRLEGRMQQSSMTLWDKISAGIARPQWALAIMLFLLIINTAAVLFTYSSNNISLSATEVATVDEYNEATANLIDYENIRP